MKKILSLILVSVLVFSLAACGKEEVKEAPIVSPTNLTFSLIDGEDDFELEGFEAIDEDPFIAEEGSTVLEATQLYCMSHDISISLDDAGRYVTEIAGVTAGDFSDKTGWVFTINGEMGTLAADEEIIDEGDKIAWEFVDFSAVP